MQAFGEFSQPLFEASGTLVAIFDPQDVLRWANAAFRRVYGVAESEAITWSQIVRRNFEQGSGVAFAQGDFERWLLSAKSRRGKVPYRAFETDTTDGRWLWMTETVSDEGWMLCVASDVTELRSSERLLRQARDSAFKASQTDDLTGISNRRHAMEVLAQMVERVTITGGHVCVALLDIDRFKAINDRFGHQFGDAVLIDFSRAVQQNIRIADCFGRVGGEEFMLVMPRITPGGAELFIERLLRLLARPGRLPQQPELQYSFSAGLTEIKPGDSVQDVYKRADAALYDAKFSGRGRLMIA